MHVKRTNYFRLTGVPFNEEINLAERELSVRYFDQVGDFSKRDVTIGLSTIDDGTGNGEKPSQRRARSTG